MCGIAGYFTASPARVEDGRDLVARMLAALHHRGPDARDMRIDPHCGLGCTRLAIIDVEHGHMPITNEDERIVCVMNGELYNFRDVRQRLRARGHRLVNEGDSEIIPHLYEEASVGLAERLTGMFAFAVWDRSLRRLLLARDRFGIKPLFVTHARGFVLFASEVKALLATGLVEARIDRRALWDLGTAGYPMPPRTMFAGIHALPPASWQTFTEAGSDGPTSYFRVPYPRRTDRGDGPDRMSVAHAVDRVRALFDEVVADHLVADVPVGSFVSGGLDSVSVAARATALGQAPLSTFAMTFSETDRSFDESGFASTAAQAIGSRHLPVPQVAIDEADYRGAIRAMEAPQMSTIPVCMYRLGRAVRQAGLKVVLSGEGADETFAGYATFRERKASRTLYRHADVEASRRKTLDADLHRALEPWWQAEAQIEARYGLVPPSGEEWCLLADTWRAVLDPALAPWPASLADQLPACPPDLRCADLRDPLHRDLLFEQRTRLDGWVLALGDRLSMAHSVEVRVPFLDHRVVELTARVPSNFLLSGFCEKFLLREAMAGRIPDTIRHRRKRGFDAPVGAWLFGSPRPAFVDAALAPDALRRGGVFHPDRIQHVAEWLSDRAPAFRRRTAARALNLALGLQIFTEEFGASL